MRRAVTRRTLNRMAGFFLLALTSLGPAAQTPDDEVVVIVNRNNTNVVDDAFVRRVYLGAIKVWPDGTPVIVLDHPEGSEVRDTFCTAVLKRSASNVKAIWSQHIFTGKGLLPTVATPDQAVKQAVSANVGAIGYIRASQLDANVKVLGK